ncbi:MAG TPA: c-type cytochrome, partial [Blastocatellia bacterium]|nr:c-type cytochrome [Blastocatellia bacterium]
MKRILITSLFVATMGLAWSCASSDPEARKLARGKYLVENVGMCADCHSPFTDKGEPDRARWLQGSALPFAPTVPIPAWAGAAPWIAGLPNISEADAVSLLSTGKTTTGATKRPPMPQFRFSREDAEAVVAYLKSLGT